MLLKLRYLPLLVTNIFSVSHNVLKRFLLWGREKSGLCSKELMFQQVDFLQEHCEKLLIDTVCFKNCLEMYRLSTMYSCEKLEKKCWPAMLDHFSNLCKREEFMELCLEDFIKIISDDKLVKVDEEQVCETAFKWIKADVTKRKQYIYKIFRCIRLPLVSAEYLVTRLYKVPSLTENADCQRLLQEAQSYHMLPARRLDWSSRRMKYRDDDEIEEVLLVN